MPDPIIPPIADAPGVPALVPPTAPNAANEEAKFHRLFVKADETVKTQEAELATLRAEQKTRQDAELSAQEKADKRANEAEARAIAAEEKATKAETAALRQRLVAESGLKASAVNFITGTDETQIAAQIADLSTFIAGAPPAAIPPKQAGTTTQPGAGQAPTLDDQIAAAEKAGNTNLSISLKMQRLKNL